MLGILIDLSISYEILIPINLSFYNITCDISLKITNVIKDCSAGSILPLINLYISSKGRL